MKLLLLHGPATNASRKSLGEIRKKFDTNNVVVFEAEANLQTILGNLVTPSLFSDQQLIILENPPEDLAFDSLTFSDSLTLVLWFDHEVSTKKLVLESVKKLKGEILNFPEAKEISVFPFLDLLAAKDKKAFLEMEKLKSASFDIYYFITMIFYLLRNLVATPKNAPDFVRKKLERQRTGFSTEKITKLYKDILEIDFKIKSGLLEKDQAEFLLVQKFLDSA